MGYQSLTEFATQHEAIAAWNTRSHTPTDASLIEKLDAEYLRFGNGETFTGREAGFNEGLQKAIDVIRHHSLPHPPAVTGLEAENERLRQELKLAAEILGFGHGGLEDRANSALKRIGYALSSLDHPSTNQTTSAQGGENDWRTMQRMPISQCENVLLSDVIDKGAGGSNEIPSLEGEITTKIYGAIPIDVKPEVAAKAAEQVFQAILPYLRSTGRSVPEMNADKWLQILDDAKKWRDQKPVASDLAKYAYIISEGMDRDYSPGDIAKAVLDAAKVPYRE